MNTIKPTPAQIKAHAKARLDYAARLIEQAQNDLASACGELSTLINGIPCWKATSTMHDRVKALWWKVHHFRMGERYTLDDMHIEALGRQLAEAEAAVEKPRTYIFPTL